MTGQSVPEGRDKRYCGGRLRQPSEAHDGDRCTRPSGWGTSHAGWGLCKLHGGSTPTGCMAAEREQAQAVLEQAKRTFGLPLDVEPAEALLTLLATSAGAAAWLTEQVRDLPAEKVVTVDGRPHPLVALWQEERKEARAVAKTAHDAGLGERMVQLEEAKARFVITLIEALLRRLDEYVLEQTGRRVLDPLDGPVRALVAAAVAEVQEVTAA